LIKEIIALLHRVPRGGFLVRIISAVLVAGAALSARAAFAADTLKFGPPPEWVVPQAIPVAKPSEAPISILLFDQQIAFERGKTTTYSEGAVKIQNAQGLAAGNLALVWQPATDTVTVNKLQIRRGDKVIDILASGQTFTVLRRETNLDAASLDGTLTATIQPEGLQDGDIIDSATTIERSDPVLKGHVETLFGAWDSLPIQVAHATLSWPSDVHITVRQTPNLPTPKRSSSKGINLLELSGQHVEPLVPPNGAPERFKIGMLAEATDFASWSGIVSIFVPLFRDASLIPSSGALHDEVEKIRISTVDPKRRAEQALALVQDRVRYVALLMGQGGYVPASAETTWSRRFGDCKAKTALLLGILHAFGIEAEPVLVQSRLGDMIADRLPMISLFDHVLARAHIGGKDYWLDGTRTGDTDLDAIQVPDFGWGLPLVDRAQLVRMVPPPLDVPSLERRVNVDASAGIFAPAGITIEEVYRGDSAVKLNTLYSALTAEQRDKQMHDEAKGFFDSFAVGSSSIQFDKGKRELDLTIKGTATLNWKDGWFDVPTSSIAFDPDFDRPAGPLHDVPWAVSHPTYIRDKATVRLPVGFAAEQKLSAPVHETLAGVEYLRTEKVAGDVLTVDSSERSLVPEVPYTDALAAAPRLKALDNDDVYLSSAVSYQATVKDLSALATATPESIDDYLDRGNTYLDNGKFDDAVVNFTKALSIDPKNVIAHADRAFAYIYKKDLASAEKDIASAESIDPVNAVMLRARAMMAQRNDDTDEAIEYYSKSLKSEPGNAFALFQRSSLYLEREDYILAISDISDILAKDPNNLAALVQRANIYVAKQDYDSAKKDLAAAQSIDPNSAAVLEVEAQLAEADGNHDAEIAADSRIIALAGEKGKALARRAEAYRRANRFAEALADSAEAIKLGDKDTELHLTRANTFMIQGNRDGVAAEAEAMIRDDPRSTYALVAAGKSYAAIHEQQKAMDALTRALAIKPEAFIYMNRAQVRPRSDLAGRMADLAQALKLDADNSDALSLKATFLSENGEYAKAADVYEQALKSAPSDSFYLRTKRAAALYKAARIADATSAFAALEKEADSPTKHNSLCWEKATAGVLLDSALQDCRNALTIRPGNSAYLDSLGMVLLKLGKIDEALDAYNRAIANGSGAASLMGRALIYLRKGNRARAEADAAAARKRNQAIDEVFADYGLKFDAAAGPSSAAAH
jgi:tetratricopeptide (TPR) repeat protein